MKKLLFFLILINARESIGQTYILIPDANFATYLQGLIPTAMSGNSLDITNTLVTTATQTINVNNYNTSNLTGIQYFSSLNYLSCANNSISTLPTLPNSLQVLLCYNNSLTLLPILPNSLKTLVCGSNSLSSLPTLPNSLTYLDCNNNLLSNLPTLSNSLQVLWCYNNSLTNLPVLPNSISGLMCQNNTLTNLALPNSLTYLICSFNSLTSLPTLPNSLQILECKNNNIACFPTFPNSINSIDISSNPFNCLPNYILSAMNNYTAYPLCAAGNSNGCPVVIGINELNLNNIQATIYPNPANEQFTIETTGTEIKTVQLFDLNGKLLLEQNINGKTNIDATNLNAGIYNLTIKTGDNIANKKLVIVH